MRAVGGFVLVGGLGFSGFVAWITGDESSLSSGAKGVVWALTVVGLLLAWLGIVARDARLYVAAPVLWVLAYATALALA